MQNIEQSIKAYMQRNGMNTLNVKAALIDMDGVLYDSMPLHTKAWHRMATEMGIDCTREEFYAYEGMTGEATINLLHNRAFGSGVTSERAKELYAIKVKYFTEQGGADEMPGAAQMLKILETNGIMRVLVTGSGQRNLIDKLNASFPGAFSEDKRVSSADVKNGKPHPEPYIKGMAKADAKPTECIVIENAPLGVQAGHRSGAFVIGITTGPIPKDVMKKAGADLVFDSMPEFAKKLPQLLDLLKTITID